LVTSIIAAPSLMPLAFAAVTVPPSFLKTGLSLPRPSTLAFGRTCSSVVNWTVSFFCLTSTGHDLAVEELLFVGLGGPLVAAHGVGVGLLAGYAVLLRYVLAVTPMW
jgi:hypothetical protein